MKLFKLLFVLSILSSCAVQPTQHSRASLVPKSDLLVVQLVKDGLALFAAGRNLEALFKLEQARYLNPNSPKINYNLAMIRLANGEEKSAIDLIRPLLDADKTNLKYLEGLGRAYTLQNDYDSAKNVFSQGLQIAMASDKDLILAGKFSANLATLNLKLGLEEESLCYAEQAYILNASDRNLTAYLQILNAINLSQLVIDRHSRSPLSNEVEVQAELGLALYVDGQKDKARSILERFKQRKEATSFGYRVLTKLLPEIETKDTEGIDSSSTVVEKSLSADSIVYLPASLINELI